MPAVRRIRYDYTTRTAGFSQQRFDEWWNEMDRDDDQQVTKEEMAVMMDRLWVIIATHSTHTLSCWSTLLFSVRLRCRRENKDRKSKTMDWFKKLAVFALVFEGWFDKEKEKRAENASSDEQANGVTVGVSRRVFESFYAGLWPNGTPHVPNQIKLSTVISESLGLVFRGAA